jgi:hypothetical protein
MAPPWTKRATYPSPVRRLLVVLLPLLLLSTGIPAYAVPRRIPLPVGTDVDYQLGGSRSVPANVGIVVRDRASRPLNGAYNVCYVNGFQTQPNERRFWRHRMGLVLRRHGHPVVDSAWGEWLLDIRTSRKRHRLADIMGRWTRGCAKKAFDAVEYDNLDSFTRGHGLLRRKQAIAYARLLVARAHAAGLAAGQKNLSDFNGRRIGYDFAVAEECGRYDECHRYVDDFGDQVLMIEYRAADFEKTCAGWGATHAVVLRDRDLTPEGVHQWC